jgi:hypothetical protein
MESKQLFNVNNLLILSGIVFLAFCYKYKEKFNDEKKISQIILASSGNKFRYNYKYDIIKIDEMTHKIFNQTKNNQELLEKIKLRLIDIYGEIQSNEEMKKFLKFNNLINDEGLPIFINESPEVLLLNEIKILLITLPKEQIENFYSN